MHLLEKITGKTFCICKVARRFKFISKRGVDFATKLMPLTYYTR